MVRRAEDKQGESGVGTQKAESDATLRQADSRVPGAPVERKRRRRQADSSDWISSQLTRRFGLAGGLAWLGFLTFGVVGEQVKTRLENRSEVEDTKEVSNAPVVTLKDGLQYQDVRVGGGQAVRQGFLTVLHYKAFANDDTIPFEDTKKRGKPIVFIYGARPFTAGLCLGVEEALRDMRGGGVRKVTVPPELGFGSKGISLRSTVHVPDKEAQAEVPPDATLRYELELVRVSIPPS